MTGTLRAARETAEVTVPLSESNAENKNGQLY
jgi:hypothetical protein